MGHVDEQSNVCRCIILRRLSCSIYLVTKQGLSCSGSARMKNLVLIYSSKFMRCIFWHLSFFVGPRIGKYLTIHYTYVPRYVCTLRLSFVSLYEVGICHTVLGSICYLFRVGKLEACPLKTDRIWRPPPHPPSNLRVLS